MFSFDEFERADMAVLMSHANSNPREALSGKSTIQMQRFVYGEEDADALLDAFGIREMGRDELMLKPEILVIERAKRGKAALSRLSSLDLAITGCCAQYVQNQPQRQRRERVRWRMSPQTQENEANTLR